MGACLEKSESENNRQKSTQKSTKKKSKKTKVSFASDENQTYSFTFPSPPLGINFGSTHDRKNLFVASIKPDSIAKGKVSLGSVITKFQHETVENLGAKKVHNIFANHYINEFPLKITFRKSSESRPNNYDPKRAKQSISEAGNEGTDIANSDDLYSHTFTSKPLGLAFGKTKDKKNLCVTDIEEGVADGMVVLGSIVVSFNGEKVENLGAKMVYKTFSNKYNDVLPLKITFRKPQMFNGSGVQNGNDNGHIQAYDNEDESDVYSFGFTQKPFGFVFEKTKNGKNLFVSEIDSDSTAKGKVKIGSVVIKFQNESVEGLGAKKIHKIFTGKYKDTLPLIITFRKGKIEEYIGKDRSENEVKSEEYISAMVNNINSAEDVLVGTEEVHIEMEEVEQEEEYEEEVPVDENEIENAVEEFEYEEDDGDYEYYDDEDAMVV